MLNDISSTNGVASSPRRSYMGVATNLQGGGANGTNDIFIGSAKASVRADESAVSDNNVTASIGSTSFANQGGAQGANDTSSMSAISSISRVSNFLSSQRSNQTTNIGQAPIY